MDTGNIMENQLQDQYDGWENEQIEQEKERQRAIADRIALRIKKSKKPAQCKAGEHDWDYNKKQFVKICKICGATYLN